MNKYCGTKIFSVLGILVIVMMLISGCGSSSANNTYTDEIAEPTQVDIKSEEIIHSGSKGDVGLWPRAEFEVTGVVKSKKKYSDFTSQISEYDLVIAWGELNQGKIDSFIKYSQKDRLYNYEYDASCPVNDDYISRHSTNINVIHKNDDILNKIKDIKEGDQVRLKGTLVDVDFKEDTIVSLWKTSKTRDSRGEGSSEIMYVEEVSVVN